MAYFEDEEEEEAYIEGSIERIEAIENFAQFVEFCEDFKLKTDNDRPVDVSPGEVGDLAALKAFPYPADFVEWHEKFGHIYFWLESTKVVTTDSVVSEMVNGFSSLLVKNGYLVLTTDASGNAFVLDTNMEVPEIKFSQHDSVYSNHEDVLELYEEHFELDTDDEGKIVAQEGFELDKIYDGEGNFILDNPYLKRYFAENLEATGYTDFLGFLKGKLMEGIKEYFVM